MSQAMGAQGLRRKIIGLHFEGKTPETIAEELEWDLGYIVRRLHEADLMPHIKPETIERAMRRHEEILTLGRENVPRHEIAKRLEVPWTTVAEALDKANIKPILPACIDIMAWAKTLSPLIEEIKSAHPNAEPILEKVDSLERELVAITEAATKAGERMSWIRGDSERWCLADAKYLANESLDLIEALRGCIEQREVAKLPRVLDQAETCIKNVSNIMTTAISVMGEEQK